MCSRHQAWPVLQALLKNLQSFAGTVKDRLHVHGGDAAAAERQGPKESNGGYQEESLQSQETLADGVLCELGHTVAAELVHDAAAVRVHRVLADGETVGRLFA